MPRPDRDLRILSDVMEWMRYHGVCDTAYSLQLKYEGGGHIWESGEDWPEAAAAAPKPAGKFLSPLGQRIVDYLRGRGTEYTPGKQIAADLEEGYSQRFQGVLTDLVDRDVLDSLSSAGYRLMPANGPNVPGHRAHGET
jgi:hypothetical protein